MLSDSTIATVKATAPVLAQMGEALTRHFYERLFRANPEVAPYFNRANQGKGRQQKALAAAICAFAANVDNLPALGSAVELIAQKHASLQIQPEHYPIVGENLLASIREVLGEAATEEIMTAWAEAYGFLADIMIGREKQIYHELQTVEHGWSGFKNFRVVRKEMEGEAITSFYLQPADGGGLPLFKPGQYITVRVPMPDGTTTMRNYSLSDRPGRPWYRISVKRERGQGASAADGYVSNYLHDHLKVAALVEVGPPCGEFFLDVTEQHRRPLVLLSAGVGITPLMSILQSAVEATPERRIVFLHANLSHRVHAFKETVEELAAEHPNLEVHYRYEDPASTDAAHISEGRIDAELIEKFVPEHDADYYFCGPEPFMVSIYHQLLKWGMPASQARFEFFGPRQDLERAAA